MFNRARALELLEKHEIIERYILDGKRELRRAEAMKETVELVGSNITYLFDAYNHYQQIYRTLVDNPGIDKEHLAGCAAIVGEHLSRRGDRSLEVDKNDYALMCWGYYFFEVASEKK